MLFSNYFFLFSHYLLIKSRQMKIVFVMVFSLLFLVIIFELSPSYVIVIL